MLKPGFRHCFVCLRDGDYWLLVDAALGVPLIKVLQQADFGLAAFYRELGFTVVETTQNEQPIRCPVSLASCVGVVKAVLAIRAPFVWSPYQLYKHLVKHADRAKAETAG